MLKRGQATIFIIIGVILIAVASVVIYVKTAETNRALPPEIAEVEEMPSDVLPIKQYIEECIGKTAEEGIRILSEHGGYIYQSSFNAGSEPTEGNAVEVFPKSKFYVPYWHYMKSPNSCISGCIFTSEMPQLCRPERNCLTTGENSIEAQLDRYITSELKHCLDFRRFKKEGINVVEKGAIQTTSYIIDKEVVVIVNYPLEINKLDEKTKIKEFRKSVESDLSEMYEMAFEIASADADDCFIGDHAIEYYSYYMGLDEDDLPPVSDVTVGSSKTKQWNLKEVEKSLKIKTANAMVQTGMRNTSSFRFPEVTEKNYAATRRNVYGKFVFNKLKRYHDATINFNYFTWMEPYLDIQPREGSTLLPTDFEVEGILGGISKGISKITQTKIYEFYYQYSFPVIIDIRKKDKTGKENVFRFALEENIRANECFKANGTIIHATSSDSILCDKDQRTEELSVLATDEQGNPLSDVDVSFYAGQSCKLGATDADGKLETDYPRAYGSFLKFKKEGYNNKLVHQTNFTRNMIIEMSGISKLRADVKKYVMIYPDMCCGESKPLSKKDKVVINMERVKDPNDLFDQELTQAMIFDGSDSNKSTGEIELIPGKYKIDSQYISTENYTILKRCTKVCTDGSDDDCKDWDYFPNQSRSMNAFSTLQIDNETGYWDVTEANLTGKSAVEFYVIRLPKINCDSKDNCALAGGCIGLEEIGKGKNYSTSFRNYIMPKLI